MHAYLDENGEFVMFSMIDATVWVDGEECWITDQNPPPGTVFVCEQTVEVQLQYTCDGETTHPARLNLHLHDITPPEIDIVLNATADPDATFSGTLYYLVGNVVAVEAYAYDACDPEPVLDDVRLNGEPYTLGDAITDAGLYTLVVRALDQSGNASFAVATFEIRERPSYTAAVVLEDSVCAYDQDGFVESIEVTALLASKHFDPQQVILSSVRLLMYGVDGRLVHHGALPIAGALQPGSTVLQHETAQVSVSPDCYVRMTFTGDFTTAALEECPAYFTIIGAGHDGETITFQWGAQVSNEITDNAVQTLLGIVDNEGECDDEPGDPDPDPPVGCEPEPYLIAGPPNICNNAPPVPGLPCNANSVNTTTATAGPTHVKGESRAFTGTGAGACNVGSQCLPGGQLVQNSAVFVVEFVGDCCNCEISFNLGGHMTASAQVTGTNAYTGAASAFGDIQFTSPCGSTTLAVNANANGQNQPDEDDDYDVRWLSCIDPHCASVVFIATAAQLGTNGTAGPGWGMLASVTATSNLKSWPQIDYEATADPCDDGWPDPGEPTDPDGDGADGGDP